MIIIDVECYKNYFLLAAKQVSSGKVAYFELYDGKALGRAKLEALMSKYTTVSFNGLSYDLPMITGALKGWSNESLKRLSDEIITSKRPSWAICRDIGLRVPAKWDHIDLIEVAPGQASLKIYGGRLNAPRLQDLPITPDAMITAEQREQLRRYCVNDLDTTALLLKQLEKPIALRAEMSEQYGMDLRSKSDAQIAETIIKSELKAITGKDYRAPRLPDGVTFRYQDPQIVTFNNPALQEVFERILNTEFELGLNGSVQMPEWLKKTKIELGGAQYQMGIGGLHSCEKQQHVTPGQGERLCDVDVASYYPNIILQQSLAPETLGKPFLDVYQSLVTRRLGAKKAGDKSTADTLKIAVNGSFGKLGSKYSPLYAPDLLIQTTLTGQLALLMLIERMPGIGVRVVSANTDGIVCLYPETLEAEFDAVQFEWMLDTSYELERTDYREIASRDVNNYLAVTLDGKVKRKGVFAPPGLQKNPNLPIIYDAVCEYVANGTALEDTIQNCTDITKFVTVRRVTGGAVWRGEELGKAVRFYYSTAVQPDECIHYAKNSNRVPNSGGAMPMMDLPGTFPDDVNFAVYVAEAEKVLADIGM